MARCNRRDRYEAGNLLTKIERLPWFAGSASCLPMVSAACASIAASFGRSGGNFELLVSARRAALDPAVAAITSDRGA